MRVLLTSYGSTGDIFPKIRLGKALLDAGHQVAYATSPFFRADIERAGLEFVYLPPDWDQVGFSEAMRDLTRARHNVELLRTIYEQSLPFLDDIIERLNAAVKECDIFVSSYLFGHLGCIARKWNKPFAVVTFAHAAIPTPEHPPEPVPALPFLPRPLRYAYSNLFWHVADRFIVHNINSLIGPIFQRNGLPNAQTFLFNDETLSLVAVSPALMRPAHLPDNPHRRFIGYLRWQSPEDPQLGRQLEEFTGGKPVPILNFGSVTFEETRKVMRRFVQHWPAGKKIIVQSGWAGLAVEKPRPEIRVVGKVSHDQLFRFASVVIHHGGAGTTASVLHAGVPNLVIPHIADQFFFASEVHRIGAGYSLHRRRWPEHLPALVAKIEGQPALHQRCREIASILAREDGPAAAVRALEELAAGRLAPAAP